MTSNEVPSDDAEGRADSPPWYCPRCGYLLDSFACRIRHLQMNTGDAKAARD